MKNDPPSNPGVKQPERELRGSDTVTQPPALLEER
jgi:hypothetical protein